MPTLATRSFRQVLCPVDFSEHSRTALRYAVALAHKSRGRLTVLFVNDPLLALAAGAAAYDVERLTETTDKELRRFVARTIGKAASDVAVEMAFGHPAAEIKKAAKRLGADLVVMGSRGLTGPGKWFFGSTTERTLRIADAPTLVIPRSGKRTRAGWAAALRAWPGKRVVIPVDLGDYALADVRAATDMARAFGAKVVFVSVIIPAQLPHWLTADNPMFDRDRVEAARQSLDKLARTLGIRAESHVAVGDPAGQIAACAADADVGLIILTLKRGSGVLAAPQGSITYGVICGETAPVLAIPARRRRS